MKKERYDYICSIGSSCLCAMSLHDAGLRLSSGPFDWLLGPSLKSRAEMIANGFAGWFEREDLRCIGKTDIVNAKSVKIQRDGYVNDRTGYTFLYDFDAGSSFDEAYPAVREKYERRIERFYNLMRASRRVLLVWVENQYEDDRPSDEEVAMSLKILKDVFPGVKVELLIIDRAPDGMTGGELVRKDGYWRVECAYRRKATKPNGSGRSWDFDIGQIQVPLSSFEARDYRSTMERRGHDLASCRAKYALFGARGPIGYALSRLQVKTCKLLLNRLWRKGVDMRWVFDAQIRVWK